LQISLEFDAIELTVAQKDHISPLWQPFGHFLE
jgi:hypothetical protein